MAYSNFKPEIYTAQFETELERILVFAEDCNREYEGEVKQAGDRVKILGVGDPTITTVQASEFSGLSDPENVEDMSQWLTINQMSHYNSGIGDIDKAQSKGRLMDIIRQRAAYKVANEMDKFIAGLYTGAKETIDVDVLTKSNALETIDEAIEVLREHDVPVDMGLVLTCSPKFFRRLIRAYVEIDTDNSKMLKNGRVGKYGNVTIKVSNNVAKDASLYEKIMLRTKNAIAFVNPLNVVEPYRVEKDFRDALKGFSLYDGKVVRPEQIVVINVQSYTAVESV
jgi:hypothetical protein